MISARTVAAFSIHTVSRPMLLALLKERMPRLNRRDLREYIKQHTRVSFTARTGERMRVRGDEYTRWAAAHQYVAQTLGRAIAAPGSDARERMLTECVDACAVDCILHCLGMEKPESEFHMPATPYRRLAVADFGEVA